MNIIVCFRQDVRISPVQAYPHSYVKELKKLGHNVKTVGEGHDFKDLYQYMLLSSRPYDLVLEIDNGRNTNGSLSFQVPDLQKENLRSFQTAVIFIDSHGHPDLHKDLAPKYNHVFFAVWDKRDLFKDHISAHWCPNITDFEWFGRDKFQEELVFDFGFFGSKKGLIRAEPLLRIGERRGWQVNVREVVKPRRHRWPETGRVMSRCHVLFNRGQKHDGPNQRVMESMACGRPFLNDLDSRSGMDCLFKNGIHYLGYDPNNESDLEEKMEFLLNNPVVALDMAERAYQEVLTKHTAKNRVQQILEVVCK